MAMRIFINIENEANKSVEEPIDNKDTNYSLIDDSIQYNYDIDKTNHYYSCKKIRYQGDWVDGVPNGNGVMYNLDGEVIFDGNWKKGILEVDALHHYDYTQNEMKVFYPDGYVQYQGGWEKGLPNGKGSYYDKDGKRLYEGHWKNGLICLKSPLFFEYASGKFIQYIESLDWIKYQGEVKDGNPSGTGTSYHKNKKKKYEGEWQNGTYNGYGSLFDEKESLVYRGYWKKGIPNGIGAFYEKGMIQYQGNWMNGRILVKGNKWFHFTKREIETVLPLSKQMIPKKLKVIVLSIYRLFLYRSSVIVHNGLGLLVVNPSVRELTFDMWFSIRDVRDKLVISGYPFLKSITFEEDSLDTVEHLVVESDKTFLNSLHLRQDMVHSMKQPV